MNPHQKPQEDVVGLLRAALRPLALADIDVSGTAACGITREDIIRAVDAYEASAGATSAYEAGRRDMREAAGKVGEAWFLSNYSEEASVRAQNIRDDIRALPTKPLGGEG